MKSFRGHHPICIAFALFPLSLSFGQQTVFKATFDRDPVGEQPLASPPGLPSDDRIGVVEYPAKESLVRVTAPSGSFQTRFVTLSKKDSGGFPNPSPGLAAIPSGAPLRKGIYSVKWTSASRLAENDAGSAIIADDALRAIVTVSYLEGTIRFQDGTGMVDTRIPYLKSTPQSFEVVVDLTQQTFDLLIDGRQAGNGRRFQRKDNEGLALFGFEIGGTAAGIYALDNISIARIQQQAIPQLVAYQMDYAFLPVSEPPKDLRITGIEVTQAIQRLDNSIRLVDDRDTVARIFVRADGLVGDIPNVHVRLYFMVGPSEGAVAALRMTVKQHPARAYISHTANVFFNTHGAPLVGFWAEVDPNNEIAETDEGNNRYPAAGTVDIQFHDRAPLRVGYIEVDYQATPPADAAQVCRDNAWTGLPSSERTANAIDWTRKTYPIPNDLEYVDMGNITWPSDNGTLCQNTDRQGELLRILGLQLGLVNLFRAFVSQPPLTNAYAFLPENPLPGGNGLGEICGTLALGNTESIRYQRTMAHEIGHNYGRLHDDEDPSWPRNDDDTLILTIQEFGFDIPLNEIKTPNRFDFMVPGLLTFEAWISPYTWEALFDEFAPAGGGGFFPVSSGPALIVTGILDQKLVPRLGPIYEFPQGTTLSPEAPNGPYAIVLADAAGRILLEHRFAGLGASDAAGEDNRGGAFAETIEKPQGTFELRLLDKGKPSGAIQVSRNPPTVRVLDPNGGEAPSGPFKATWQADDRDGDKLNFLVLFSNNGGESFRQVAETSGSESVILDAGKLPGGEQCLIRVIASDGLLSRSDDSDGPFAIALKPPAVAIVSPMDGSSLPLGSLVVLKGTAMDKEDVGQPDPEAFLWSSSIQGPLGTGPSVPVNDLQPGEHVIRLEVTDSDGMEGSAETKVRIAVPLSVEFKPEIILPTTDLLEATVHVPISLPKGLLGELAETAVLSRRGMSPVRPSLEPRIGDFDQDGVEEILLSFRRVAYQKILQGLEGQITLGIDGAGSVGPLHGQDDVEVRGLLGKLFRRGDADGSGAVDITDAIVTLTWLFLGGEDLPCSDAADSNDSGVLDISDPIRALEWLFLGRAEPPPPGPKACGPDPSDDGIGCENDSC